MTTRRRFPHSGKLITIEVEPACVWVALGDVLGSIPRAPLLVMEAAHMNVIGYRQFATLDQLYAWVGALEHAEEKEAARGLLKLCDWLAGQAAEIRDTKNEVSDNNVRL